jgi:hypothetical protein
MSKKQLISKDLTAFMTELTVELSVDKSLNKNP